MPPPPPNSHLDMSMMNTGVQTPLSMLGIGEGHPVTFNDLLYNGTFFFGEPNLPFPFLEDEVV